MRTRTPRLAADARRSQILDATLRVVARDGYSGLTMEVIAKEAGGDPHAALRDLRRPRLAAARRRRRG
ncbi:TetR family transcriptional regulator [Svornostia abyssi]|uniref:TetR family transcriptional regulator n=1 Tax=Svornostia abyssi TaxID=2898438 RepID=A0ABY5PAN9_9ACTN|nr:TetR family transcriptional regulator [Parviterribacteraceae bacterium J379]